MISAAELKEALASCTHVKAWALNAERGCLEITHKIFHADGTEVHEATHNYHDDLTASAPSDGLPKTAEEGTATIDHLTAELASYTPAQIETFGVALKARIDELIAAGHTPSAATAIATTPTTKAPADVQASANAVVALTGVAAGATAGGVA